MILVFRSLHLLKVTFILIFSTFLLVTCAPIPKEEESRQQAEVSLTLQHRADRLARAGTDVFEQIFIFLSLSQFAKPPHEFLYLRQLFHHFFRISVN